MYFWRFAFTYVWEYMAFTDEHVSVSATAVPVLEEGDGSTRNEITVGYEPSHMGVGNQI